MARKLAPEDRLRATYEKEWRKVERALIEGKISNTMASMRGLQLMREWEEGTAHVAGLTRSPKPA
jgi:hypothetical protein